MPLRRRRGLSRGKGTVVLVLLLVLLLAGGAWWWLQVRDAGEAPAEEVAAAPDERDVTGEPAVDLPELDASDELVRRMASALSSRPALAEWLATEDLIRRFVGAVVVVAAGSSPRDELEMLEPGGEFRVEESDGAARGDTVVVDPASYRRYDPVAATFVSLDTPGTAELYRRLAPLFQEAYRDLGFRRGTFDRVLVRAMEHLLAVPVPEGPVEVVPAGGRAFEYVDPELEGLSPAQKHLLRMGPDNIRRIQAKLRELAEALELRLLRVPRG